MNVKVAITEIYPRIPCELVADHGSAEHTLGTNALQCPNMLWGVHPLHCTVRTGDPSGLKRLGCHAEHIRLLASLRTRGVIFPFPSIHFVE
jgi:hypothetical protein